MKPIPGYEGLYSIDEYGNVLSHKFGKLMRWSFHKTYKAPFVTLKKDGVRVSKPINVLVMLVYGPQKPSEDCVIVHKDFNNANPHISNLVWRTRSSLYIDMRTPEYRRKHIAGIQDAMKVVCENRPLARQKGVVVTYPGGERTFDSIDELLSWDQLPVRMYRRKFNRIMNSGGCIGNFKFSYV